jgi:hypothetical protein
VVAAVALLNPIPAAFAWAHDGAFLDLLVGSMLRLRQLLFALIFIVLLAGLAVVEWDVVSGTLTKMAISTLKETAVRAVVDVTTIAATRKTVAVVGILAAHLSEQAVKMMTILISTYLFV